jgi:cellulose synthase/poly-beta-1,6-N-acetylglucosamine synthase-like glycosyltransferase
MLAFVVTVAVVFLFLAIHPFVTYPMSLRLVRAVRGVPGAVPAPTSEPSFAICMSAFNEEAVIVQKVNNLLTLKSTVRNCEIFIYVDAAIDRTAALLAPFADQVVVVVGQERHGKSHGLNELVKRTTADILVFTDANVVIDPDALKRIGARFADPSIGCVCGNLIYTNDAETATAATGGLYWRIEEAIKQLESDTFGIVGADGSLFAIRRELHVPVAPDVIDDFYISMKILLGGHRVVREPTALAFERSGTDGSEEFRRKIRIACQAFNVHRIIWSEVQKSPAILYCYVSHRLLKWLIIYNLLLGSMFAAIAAMLLLPASQFLGVAVVVVAGAVYFAVGVSSPARQVRSILSNLLGAGVGVWRSIMGERFQTWQPMSTARSQ